MFTLGISKKITENAPKYTSIVEPFADGGSFAFYLAKKPPKSHLVNVEDETLFALWTFLKEHSSAEKSRLKGYDWVSSPEGFDAAAAITTVDGPDLYYRYMYLKKFGAKSADGTPVYDWQIGRASGRERV